jgi:molybdopterin converting factor small subunit
MAEKMMVAIKFFGAQRAQANTDGLDMLITETTKVKDALEYVRHRFPALRLDDGMFFVTINQEEASLDRVLSANDTVSFLPHISGG